MAVLRTDPHSYAAGRAASLADWPFRGRAAELAQIHDLVTAPGCRGLLVAGPAGVGKTRLAAECAQRLRAEGHTVLRVTATTAGAAVPLSAMAALLPSSILALATVDRADLLRRAAEALVEGAGNRRVYLLADNANALDDSSAMLLHYLAHTGTVCVLATLRTGDASPSPITDLWKDGVVERYELAGLDPEAARDVLEAAVGGQVDRSSALRLAERSTGNLLYLRELVVGALRAGAMRCEDDVWYLAEQAVPSDRLVELIEARLGRLDKTEWRLLELLAFGEPIAMRDLERLATADVAARLESKGLLTSSKVADGIELRLSHPLYGDVVRDRTSALRVPELARALAEAVEARAEHGPEDGLRVATWRLECGGAPASLMLEAARTARRRYDFALAERLCGAAVDAGAGFEAELLAAQLACLLGREGEAEALLVDLGSRDLTDAQRGSVIVSQLDTIGFYTGRVTEGTEIAERAAVQIDDAGWRDEIEGRKAAFVLATDGPTAALAISAPLMHSDARGRARVWSCIITAWTLGRRGRIAEALQVSEDGYAVHTTLSDDRLDWYPWVHLFLRCEALAHAGRFDEAQRIALEQYQAGLAMKSVEAQAFFSWHLATTVGERGSTLLALQHAREAINQFRGLGRPQYMRELLLALSLGAALEGDAATAKSALESLAALELDSPPWKTTELYLARAWVHVADGDVSAALCVLREGVGSARERGDAVGESSALHTLARLGHAKEALDRLTELGAVIEGRLIQARVLHVRALVDGDPHELSEAAGAFEAMGAHLLAAEAAADAAVAWRRIGNPRQTAAADAFASQLADRIPTVRTPALRSSAARASLTPTERDVGLLAATGRTNRRIADELSISVRTVENHLQRTYAKLGIKGRSQLAQHLDREPFAETQRTEARPHNEFE